MGSTGIAFKKAVKAESKLRMALAGPSGAGKTYTALSIASGLVDAAGDGSIAVIDTERGSATKYADLFQFDVLELETFHPDRYIEAILAAQDAGYSVLVIDSLTHAWNGKGGLLELVDAIAKRSYQGNTFRAWGEATPIQNRMIDTITTSRLHIIATMRSKTEYVVESNDRGKNAPRKVGMAAVQRDGMEYEFDVFGQMTIENELIIEKSRCPELAGQIIRKPGADVAQTLAAWLHGAPVPQLRAVPTPPAPQEQPEPVDPQPSPDRCAKALADAGVLQLLNKLGRRNEADRRTELASVFDAIEQAEQVVNLKAIKTELDARITDVLAMTTITPASPETPALNGVDMGAPGN